MNLKLQSGLWLLFLTACAAQPVKDDSPANDLDVLAANVRKTTTPTLLPNGKEYCFELSLTEDDQDDCTGDLEDALYNSNRKGERTRKTVTDFVAREKLRRNPCNWFERMLRYDRCSPKNSTTPP